MSSVVESKLKTKTVNYLEKNRKLINYRLECGHVIVSYEDKELMGPVPLTCIHCTTAKQFQEKRAARQEKQVRLSRKPRGQGK